MAAFLILQPARDTPREGHPQIRAKDQIKMMTAFLEQAIKDESALH
jgi:hypothetical protein